MERHMRTATAAAGTSGGGGGSPSPSAPAVGSVLLPHLGGAPGSASKPAGSTASTPRLPLERQQARRRGRGDPFRLIAPARVQRGRDRQLPGAAAAAAEQADRDDASALAGGSDEYDECGDGEGGEGCGAPLAVATLLPLLRVRRAHGAQRSRSRSRSHADDSADVYNRAAASIGAVVGVRRRHRRRQRRHCPRAGTAAVCAAFADGAAVAAGCWQQRRRSFDRLLRCRYRCRR